MSSLIAFVVAAYGRAASLPFLGDDYVFLDKTRYARFVDLWSRLNTDFGWYRPWSRELHFWVLQHLFGIRETGFHVASGVLWLLSLLVYARVVDALAGRRAAWLAVLGVASLGLWGAPLLWISGAQDLWMLVFSTLTILLVVRGRIAWAIVPFVGALLSKETAAVLPLILLAHEMTIGRLQWSAALRRIGPFFVVASIWYFAHPVLSHRFASPALPAGEARLAPLFVLARMTLATLNLDFALKHFDPLEFDAAGTVLSTSALLVGVLASLRAISRTAPSTGLAPEAAAARFGLAWMAIASIPLLMPTIGWHAYYGSLAVLGSWLLAGTWLARRPKVAVATIALLGALRGVDSASSSWDWGSEWYQRRAGQLLLGIRSQLLALRPTLPHHARVYFGNVPNNIGLVAGQSPAVRIWYGDTTLRAGFYSYYRARGPDEPEGPDFFFRFDTTRGLREVVTGPEDALLAVSRDPEWERDHEALALTLLRQGGGRDAAVQFEKLAQLPWRPDASMYAGVCWESVGDEVRAESLYALTRRRTGESPVETREWAARLRATMPGR